MAMRSEFDPQTNNGVADAAAILAIVEDTRRGVCAKDLRRVLSHYAPEVVTFDLVEPMVHRGIDEVRARLRSWFDSFRSDIQYEHRNAELRVRGDVAFGYRTTHVRGTNVFGELIDMWFRETICFRKIEGVWKIVHQHSSVPLEVKTLKGMLDLQPS